MNLDFILLHLEYDVKNNCNNNNWGKILLLLVLKYKEKHYKRIIIHYIDVLV